MISNPSASHSTASSAAAASVTPAPSGAFILKTISGSIFGEIMRASDERGLVAGRVLHGVVVHVRPDECVELEHAPHRLVGVADLDADGRAAGRATHPHQLRFDRVGRGEIEAGVARGRRRHEHDARRPHAASSAASACGSITPCAGIFAVLAFAGGLRGAKPVGEHCSDQRHHGAAVEAHRPAAEPLEEQRADVRRR